MDEVSFLTLKNKSEGFFKEKGSKFLGSAHPIMSIEDAKAILDNYRKEYYDARHVCFAYVLGVDGETTRAYDDGEPGHSAGDPILGQIKSAQLTNVLVIVIRYFGGTKLGVSGLINAYKTAAAEALDKAEVIKTIPKEEYCHAFAYEDMNRIMGVVKMYDLQVVSQVFELSCEITLAIPLHQIEEVKRKLNSQYD